MMRVGIATVQVPFITGGAEIHARILRDALLARGHEAEIITIPFRWDPPSQLESYCAFMQQLDLSHVNGQPIDRLITMKFPMYLVQHPNKVGWILHQHRQAYELYETAHSDMHLTPEGREAAMRIRKLDTLSLPTHKRIFTNSQTVADRLWNNNRVHARALYHPPEFSERFYCETFGDYILVPGRLESIKRQNLILEAIAQLPHTRLIVIGNDRTPFGESFKRRVAALGLENRIEMRGFVDFEEKARLYANALAVYNGAFDEDYGYVTLEAFFAHKPVITHHDSGGPLEFVKHGINGLISQPDAQALADVLNGLDVSQARAMGEAGRQTVDDLGMYWDNITDQLLGEY